LTADHHSFLSGRPGVAEAQIGSADVQEVVATALDDFSRQARNADFSPRVLIDSHCNVLWRSAQTERLLRPPIPLAIKASRLQGTGSSTGQTWLSFVEGLDEAGSRLLLIGDRPDVWVLLRGWARSYGAHRLVFIKCALSWPYSSVATSGLAKNFGLTKSECAVLDEFARLAKPDQIAERLSISVGTVRSHLKLIHSKMSVKSSVQLLRITRAYTDT